MTQDSEPTTQDQTLSTQHSVLGTLTALGRWLLLLLLAGHLLFRREFAHRNLGELFGVTSGRLAHLYVTELCLVLLLPIAVLIAWKRGTDRTWRTPGIPQQARGLGPGFWIALAFLLWGGGHALAAYCSSGTTLYLILRQSALAWYAVFFLYAFLFFGGWEVEVRQAVLCALGLSLLCAVLDTCGLLNPKPDPMSLYPNESLFGQETLAIAILGLGMFVIEGRSFFWQGLALGAMLFAGWRQGQRTLQSSVLASFGGALVLYLLLAGWMACRGQLETLKRAGLLVVLYGLIFLACRGVLKFNAQESEEINAWSWRTYRELLDLYDRAAVPDDPRMMFPSAHKPGVVLSDPEAHKLETVYRAARDNGGDSVINNIWRLLLWRRMLHDWKHGHPVLGAGVGQAWDFNGVLEHTHFHHERDPGGLNPHNSFLNVLYRYGIIGLVLLLALVGSALYAAVKALDEPPEGSGAPTAYSGARAWLEVLVLYFFYTLIFSFFTVGLEGPSYALPFWFSLGLVYARARQMCERASIRL
ncbi:MAG: O-antigen ligase family protein [Planctomycetota bacterium]